MVFGSLKTLGSFVDVAVGGGRPSSIDEPFSAGELRHHVCETLQTETLDQRVPRVGKVSKGFGAFVVDVADNFVRIDLV